MNAGKPRVCRLNSPQSEHPHNRDSDADMTLKGKVPQRLHVTSWHWHSECALKTVFGAPPGGDNKGPKKHGLLCVFCLEGLTVHLEYLKNKQTWKAQTLLVPSILEKRYSTCIALLLLVTL